MRYINKHIMLVLMLLLVPIYLVSCSGNASTSLPSSNSSAALNKGEPTNVTAVGSDSRAVISWTPPLGAITYNLYWNTTQGVTTDSNKILNVYIPFDHRDLMNGKTYYYRVSAVYMNGESRLSTEVHATPMLPFTKILTKLTDPDAEVDDKFGSAVAIDSDYAVVGAEQSDQGYGAAYVFHRDSTGAWDPAGARLTAPTSSIEATRFGYSVSISGDYVIVGAPGEHTGEGGEIHNAGAVYIFHRTGVNTWDAGVRLVSNEWLGRFGCSVGISGDYAIVGERGESGAWIFHRIGTNAWDGGTNVVPEGTAPDDNFGAAVAMNGDYAVIGAPTDDGIADAFPDAGAAYIFHRTGVNSWEMASIVRPHDGEAGDWFGTSVALSDNYAAVSAAYKNAGAGAIYVFHRLEGNFWDEGPKILAPDSQAYDYFGQSIAVTDQYVLVGAWGEDCGWDNNLGEGAAYIYKRIGANSWDGGTKITIPQGDVADGFGYAVSLSGEHAIIGAIGDDGDPHLSPNMNVGAVYIY